MQMVHPHGNAIGLYKILVQCAQIKSHFRLLLIMLFLGVLLVAVKEVLLLIFKMIIILIKNRKVIKLKITEDEKQRRFILLHELTLKS
jgi:hypothetical protein